MAILSRKNSFFYSKEEEEVSLLTSTPEVSEVEEEDIKTQDNKVDEEINKVETIIETNDNMIEIQKANETKLENPNEITQADVINNENDLSYLIGKLHGLGLDVKPSKYIHVDLEDATKSPIQSLELQQEGIISGIKNIIKKIWEFIQDLYNKIKNWILKKLGFINKQEQFLANMKFTNIKFTDIKNMKPQHYKFSKKPIDRRMPDEYYTCPFYTDYLNLPLGAVLVYHTSHNCEINFDDLSSLRDNLYIVANGCCDIALAPKDKVLNNIKLPTPSRFELDLLKKTPTMTDKESTYLGGIGMGEYNSNSITLDVKEVNIVLPSSDNTELQLEFNTQKITYTATVEEIVQKFNSQQVQDQATLLAKKGAFSKAVEVTAKLIDAEKKKLKEFYNKLENKTYEKGDGDKVQWANAIQKLQTSALTVARLTDIVINGYVNVLYHLRKIDQQ